MTEIHPLLRRQLRRLNLSEAAGPDLASWQALLERLTNSYRDVDEERYTVERAFSISTREMQALYDQLRSRSELAIARERDKLAQSLAIQFAALETMRDGLLVVDVERKIVAYNRRFVQLFGIPEALLVAGDAHEVLRFMAGSVRDRDRLVGVVEHLYAHPTESAEDELLLVDGRIIERFIAPVIGLDNVMQGRMAVFRDITAQRRADDEVRRVNQFLDSIVENIPDMVFVKDADELRYVRFNRAGEEIMGVAGEDLIGRTDNDVFPGQASFFIDKDRETLATGEMLDLPHVVVQTPSGERVLHTKKIPIPDETGRPRFLLGISRDVTEDIRVKEALRTAKELAEEANRAKTRFLSNMSHELRTPLNAIVGFARVLTSQANAVSAPDREYLDYILRAGEHMVSLVNDLLDLRRIEEGRSPLEIAVHEVGGIVETAMSLVRPLLEERRHVVEIELDDEPLRAQCDARALVQVLVNLLSNAAKYTPPGGRIVVRAVQRGGQTCVEVVDSGSGIAAEDLPHLFTYFVQVGAKHRHHMGGSGVGLALTKSLVELMGGALEVESELDRGSMFRVRMPPSEYT